MVSILKAANEAETQLLLEQLKKDASDDAVKIGALIGWMNSQKISAAAVAWMKTLLPTLLVKRTTPLNLAEAFTATSDWEGLRKFCVGTKWDAFEYMRNALAARALRELGQLQESSQQWKEAVAKVGTRPEQIFGLADLARKRAGKVKRSICGGWRRKIQSMPRKLCGCFTTSMPADAIRRSFIVC